MQQRTTLAVLLLHANKPMGRDQLMEAVWGADPPAYAVNMLHRRVSALRTVLEPTRPSGTPSSMLVWTDVGYQLNVAAGALDLQVFDQAVDRARAAQGRGDLAAAGAALHEALCLWRGTPFDGLSSPLLELERDRLGERRITVIEDSLEIDLALGERRDLVAELTRLVSECPLRERLRGLLMVALYRSGRRAEALAAFRDARRHLRDELGVEPGAALQRQHQQILDGHPDLDGPAAPSAHRDPTGPADDGIEEKVGGWAPGSEHAAQAPVPAQLPHGLRHFTGRTAELERMHAPLAQDVRTTVVIAITGAPGVGKSALAIHWAHRSRDQFPDGQLYVNLRGFDPSDAAMEPDEAVRGFLDALGVPPRRIPGSLDAQAAWFRSLLIGRRMLILLDNARESEQVRPLLPSEPGCLVIVTSRNQLSGLVAAEGAYPLSLGLLSPADARRLLARRLGEDRMAAEPEPTAQIIASCAGLPLALTIVAARAAANPRFPLAALAAELREAQGRLDGFVGDEQAVDVRTIFSWSYRRLRPETARLFRLLALHPGADFSVWGAAALAGVPLTQARSSLAELTRAHLLSEQVPGRFAFHDLLGAYAEEQARAVDTEAEQRAALHRVLDYYLHGAHAARELTDPRRDPVTPMPPVPGVTIEDIATQEQARAWFRAEQHVLIAAVDRASSSGFDDHTCQLAWILTSFLEYQARWHDWSATGNAALAAARRMGDPMAEARSHRLLGRGYTHVGRFEEARQELTRALDLYVARGDAASEAGIQLCFAWLLHQQHDHGQALDHSRRALALSRAVDDRAGQASALNHVSWYEAHLGQLHHALASCRQALALYEQLDDGVAKADSWDSLGYIRHQLGHHAEAARCFQQALALFRRFGDSYNEAVTMTRLGDAQHASGDLGAARDTWQRAEAIFDQLGHPMAAQVRTKVAEATREPTYSAGAQPRLGRPRTEWSAQPVYPDL